MTDPRVPTGRELDEGLGPAASRRRPLKERAREWVTKKASGGRRSISAIELNVDEEVVQRVKQAKRPQSVPAARATLIFDCHHWAQERWVGACAGGQLG